MSTWKIIRNNYVYLLYGLFFLQSCSSSSGNKDHNHPAGPKDSFEVHTVEIKDMKFVPDSVIIKKGDRVVFVNRDMVGHCVTEENSKAWSSSTIPPGEAYMLTVDKSANYYCAIHQVMKGKIILKE